MFTVHNVYTSFKQEHLFLQNIFYSKKNTRVNNKAD